MNADKVEHRGMEAHQGVFNRSVQLFKGGKKVATIRTDKRQTADDMRRMIDNFLDNRTDEQIVQALDCCTNGNGNDRACVKCPYENYDGDCYYQSVADALDLIRRQQEKIEMLQAWLDAAIAGQHTLQQYIATMKDREQ